MSKMSQKDKNIIMTVNASNIEEKKTDQSSDEDDENTRPSKSAFRAGCIKQGIAAFAVSLYSAAIGFSSAYTAPALVSMHHNSSDIKPTPQEESWIGSLMPLSALVGGLIGGLMIEFLGRKKTIMATAFPFTMSFLMISFASNVPLIMAGRAVAGFCVGVTSLALPVYLGETLQPEVRGMLGLLPTTIGNVGILLCFVAGYFCDWRGLAFLGAIIPLPCFLLMFFIPETPTWYLTNGKQKQAQAALQWLRGEGTDVSKELSEMEKEANNQDSETIGFFDMFRKCYLWPLSIALGLMFFQQFSGINAMIFYTVSIFKDAGSTIDSNLCSIIVGLVNLTATLIATFLIDRLGRKLLLYVSTVLMAITLSALGGFFYAKTVLEMDVNHLGWLPLASFVIFVIGFSLGAGPIPWLMMGEILPAKIRGRAASIATGFNWSCTFAVTKTFIDMKLIFGPHGAFWLFAVICVFFFFFTIICVPETRGKSLADIERKFRGEKVQVRNVRRMSSLAHMKVFPSNI